MRCILGVKIPASNIPDYFDNEKTNLRERTQNTQQNTQQNQG
jgi:hypothetical protein